MATTTKCMSKMNKKELYEHCKKLTNENQKLQLFNNAQEQEINELKINQSFEMVENLTEELAKKEDIIIKLEKDNKKLQEHIVDLETRLNNSNCIFYFSYDEEGHTFYNSIQDLIRNTPRIEDCYVYEGNVSEQDIRQNDNDYQETTALEYMGQWDKV